MDTESRSDQQLPGARSRSRDEFHASPGDLRVTGTAQSWMDGGDTAISVDAKPLHSSNCTVKAVKFHGVRISPRGRPGAVDSMRGTLCSALIRGPGGGSGSEKPVTGHAVCCPSLPPGGASSVIL